MALLDIFKRKKIDKKKESPVVPDKPPKILGQAYPVRKSKISNGAYKILKKPHVTEKATDLTSKNQYIFEVYPRSNKNQIKKAVEDVYGADVVSVNIINIPRKIRKLGRISGWRKGYKKAVVRIEEGQKIEVLPR